MSLVKIILIEVSQITAPTAAVLYGFWLASQGQIILGTVIVVLALIAYLFMGHVLADALKATARAKARAEDKKLKRVERSANATERRHQLQSNARKARFGYGLLERIMRGRM